VPDGWTLTNTPSEVRISPKNQDGVMIVSASSGTTPAQASQQFVKANEVTVSGTGQETVNGMQAVVITGTLTANEQPLAVQSFFIARDTYVFSFHGLSGANEFSGYQPAFTSVPRGFRQITDKSKIAVEPQRIRIRSVDRSVTLEQALKSFDSTEQAESLAILNGMELSAMVNPGMDIKVVTR
jgi:predicted Zn-dependent protease